MQSNFQIVCAFMYGTWRAALNKADWTQRHVLAQKAIFLNAASKHL